MSKKKTDKQIIAKNKKAFHNYSISERYEAGIVLSGCEVKSIRANNVVIKDSFARVINNELFLFNCYIGPYEQGNRFNPEPERDRKLLLHRREIDKIMGKLSRKGLIMVPLSIYIIKGKVKVELGIGEPKKQHDKRQDIKEKDIQRNIQRASKLTI